MDENLNAALNSLDMLATVTTARREYLAERRYHNNICSLSCIPPWRTSTSNLLPTKENQNYEKTFLYCASRRQSEKFYNRRPRSRCLPYDIRRKHGGFNNSSSTRGGGSSSIHFPIALHQHSTTMEHSAHLDNELKTKTDKFPIPVLLFRSKSLEDLRADREGLQLQKNNYSNCIDFGPRGTINLCTNNVNIKKEIDSMSMRIEKLDVA